MNADEITTALEAVMIKYPQLHCHGYGWMPGIDLEEGRRCLRDQVDEIAIALPYLENLPRLKPGSARGRSSYSLKHRAEKTVQHGYVSNGALIAAALILDIPIRITAGNPNPVISVGFAPGEPK